MSFLSGWTVIALAAGVTLPPLIALYFLKLKRRIQPIPSTLLWKRAVQDLQVNSPFQRLRRNLLLLLQLLVLLLAAFALGRPVIQAPRTHEGTVVLMIDHSASMGVVEANGKTRLDIAKQQARRVVDNLADGSRAMLLSFGDRAAIVSSFDTDRAALKARIDSIEPTESSTTLTESFALAEAHAAGLVTGSQEDPWAIVEPERDVAASVVLFTDGRVEDAEQLTAQRFRAENMEVITIGERRDNVGITGMQARREYEQPELLEVFAEVRNFGPEPVELDATLYINNQHADVQSVRLEPGLVDAAAGGETQDTPGQGAGESKPSAGPPPGSVAAVAFDQLKYDGGGTVEVRLNVDDALAADNRAWVVIQPSRSTNVLLVTAGNIFLERVLATLPIQLETMSPSQYEAADDVDLLEAKRSRYDLVIFDGHSTDRLPPGNYWFWGAVPKIDGVSAGDMIGNEVITNWDENHPILRHVPVETVQVFRWLRLNLPPESVTLIDGESSPVLSYLARDGRQYLISAFGLLTKDEETGDPLLNTFWVTQAHFPVFVYNVVQFLSASLSTREMENVRPGEPVLVPVVNRASEIHVLRPDGVTDTVETGGAETAPYAQTRQVGVYQVRPGPEGNDTFAVNLFNPAESNVAPNPELTIGSAAIASHGGVQEVNRPIWPYLLLAALAILLLEWVIYNKRVFV